MSQKALITEADVQRAVQDGSYTIYISGEPIITPLAESSLKELGVKLTSHSPGYSNGQNPACIECVGQPDEPINVQGRSPEQLLRFFSMMWRIRCFEQAMGVLFRAKRLIGFLHLSIGQEAVPTGACATLNSDDYITLTHRGHGQMVARGSDIKRMAAELLGRSSGYCKGKGGSVHLADFQNGVLGANGIVGAGTVIATGAAMSAKIRKTKQVSLAFFGDGAVNQGAIHEAMNYASLQKLPIVYICENNQYAVSTSVQQATASKSIAERALNYQIYACQVDGQNVLAVYDTVKSAVERARSGAGPSLIECMTYRFRGHWEGETLELRAEEERKLWQQRDPIQRLEKAMFVASIATKEQLKTIYESVVNEIAEAVRFAEQSPYPENEEALRDVYVGF